MFVKKCFSCGSSSVNTLKSSNNWKTLHQFCSRCGKDQTKRVLAVKKARQSLKMPLKITKRAKTRKSHSLAFALIGWALFAFSSVIATAYAQMAEPMEYVAEIATTTPQVIVEIEKPETLMEKIDRYADEANIPRWKLHSLIKCESSYNPKAKNISSVESSHGLLQINLKAHNATIMEAQDPDYALAFAVKHWDERKSMWYNCSKKHSL